MVKDGSLPGVRVVTCLASRRESGRKMARTCCRVIIGLVAAIATACDSRVIERRSGPGRRVVTGFAVRRKAHCDVIRIRRCIELRRVALVASRVDSGMVERCPGP